MDFGDTLVSPGRGADHDIQHYCCCFYSEIEDFTIGSSCHTHGMSAPTRSSSYGWESSSSYNIILSFRTRTSYKSHY